jgi:hypothetical protein
MYLCSSCRLCLAKRPLCRHKQPFHSRLRIELWRRLASIMFGDESRREPSNSAEPKQRTVRTTAALFAASTTSINETERRLRSKEHNRADWRSTLSYARVTQCTKLRHQSRAYASNQIGTAFSTAWRATTAPERCTSLFEMSRSGPSSGRRKNDVIDLAAFFENIQIVKVRHVHSILRCNAALFEPMTFG